jgi:hypothetical protein
MLEFDAYYMYRRGQLAGHFTLKILDSKYHRNVKNIIKLYKAQLPKQDELKLKSASYESLQVVPSN